MAKQSIFGRVAQMARANINALLDAAEDPQKMLDQLVRDYTNSIADAKSAVAETVGNLRLMEQDRDVDIRTASEWGQKATAASLRADQLRNEGKTADADKFDNLAKVALSRQIAAENEVKAAEPMIASQNEVVERLKTGLQQMEQKLDQLKMKRDELVARSKTAAAQSKVADAISSINVLDPTSDLARYEDKVRREEAKVIGQQEVAASTLDAQFESIEELSAEAEVEARLAALKSGGSANPQLES